MLLAGRFATPARLNMPPTGTSMTEVSAAICRGDHSRWRYDYAMGGFLALWLDQKLHAEGRPGLPEVMLRLLENHPGGIPEDRFEGAFAAASGLDVTRLFGRFVRGTEPPPIYQILDAVGAHYRDSKLLIDLDSTVSIGMLRLRERLFGPPQR